jgi:hypothetical protein
MKFLRLGSCFASRVAVVLHVARGERSNDAGVRAHTCEASHGASAQRCPLSLSRLLCESTALLRRALDEINCDLYDDPVTIELVRAIRAHLGEGPVPIEHVLPEVLRDIYERAVSNRSNR